ncbi:MAG: hypothetical protein B7C24_12420 [Bacteroidetes bacterium 4572_77]|nr:MAG: hypothetical protein B7C24_12420 [Bacteroidetes bacterium 4572_77]
MQSVVEQIDNIVIFRLKNTRIEGDISSQLKAKMLIVAQPDIDALLIDLSSVEAMDSSGLGALLLAKRQLNGTDIPIALCGVRDFVRSLMVITQLVHEFHFFDSVEQALEEMTEEDD